MNDHSNTSDGGEYRRNTIHIRPDNSTDVNREQDGQNEHSCDPTNQMIIPDQSATDVTVTPLARPKRNMRPPTWLKDYN